MRINILTFMKMENLLRNPGSIKMIIEIIKDEGIMSGL